MNHSQIEVPAIAEDQWGEAEVAGQTSLIAVMVAVFIVAASTVAALPVWNYLVKGIGVLLGFAFFTRAFRTQFRPCAELLLYGTWAMWCLAPLVAGLAYPIVFWETWFTVLQIWVLLLILSMSTDSRRVLSINLTAFVVAAIIVGGYSVLTGEYAQAGAERKRVAGIALNSNAFAYRMLLGTIALAYLWMVQSRFRLMTKGLLIAIMAFFAMGVLVSGSRKAILGLALFYLLWVWFCYRKEMLHRPGMLLVIVLGLSLGGLAFGMVLRGSVGERRLLATYKALSGQSTKEGGEERILLYKEAMAMVAEHPFVGVGLQGFTVRSSRHLMTHSELMEVATASGVPGVLIYFGITVALWLRTSRILRRTDDPLVAKIVRLIRASIVVLLLVALGRDNYISKDYWVVVASFIGYTHALWQDLKGRGRYLSPGGTEGMYAPVSYAQYW